MGAHPEGGHGMSLTIQGAHANDVWVEHAGDFTCLTRPDLDRMASEVRRFGTTNRAGILFDESDVAALFAALSGPQIEDCADCEGPGLVEVEGRLVCPGHAAGYAQAEAESMEAAR